MTVETKRLYFDDPYMTEFDARVVEKTQHEGKYALALDRTCFYPESGGQPADRGQINGVDVLHVLEKNGKILHLIEKEIVPDRVNGRIDWEARFDHMQQHAGQHVLSQSFHELFNAKTLSFHLGECVSTIEIDLRNLSDEQATRGEERANALVFEDREIKTYFVTQEKIHEVPLRKPPQKQGPIRVVEIAEFDYSACGGTHPHRTGEVGLIKILKWDRIRDNVRFEFVCGKRALRDYASKHRILRELAVRFTVAEAGVPESAEKMSEELKNQKKMLKKAQEQLAYFEAREMIRKAEGRIIREVFSGKTLEDARQLALNIIKGGEFAVLFGVTLEKRGHLILAASEGLGFDARELIPVVSPLIDGKGGGSPTLVEIFVPDPSDIKKALDHASAHLLKVMKDGVRL